MVKGWASKRIAAKRVAATIKRAETKRRKDQQRVDRERQMYESGRKAEREELDADVDRKYRDELRTAQLEMIKATAVLIRNAGPLMGVLEAVSRAALAWMTEGGGVPMACDVQRRGMGRG